MVRSRKEWRCSNCDFKSLKFAGTCLNCSRSGTFVEKILIPAKKKASLSQRSINRRSKKAERTIGSRMLDIDGVDPAWKNVATSTGRVGHLTHLQFDTISKNYVVEAKNRKMAKWLNVAWIQIQQRSIDFHKHALLYIDPPNLPKNFPLNGEKYKTSTMHIITQERHEELIRAEQELNAIINGTKPF